MLIGGSFKIEGEVAFKIGQYVAEQTVTLGGPGHMQLADLYATSTDFEVPYTTLTSSDTGPPAPPNVIAGRAYIDGNYAPDGTVVTAWIGGEEIVEARTTVVNNPVAVVPTELVSKLETLIPPPSPLPTPCPKYLGCGEQYYSGRPFDDIDVIWSHSSGAKTWWFYSTDPAWILANNLPAHFCDYIYEGTKPFNDMWAGWHEPGYDVSSGVCAVGPWIKVKTNVLLPRSTGLTWGTEGWGERNYFEGWNVSSLIWPKAN
jgi:hypothetical protein